VESRLVRITPSKNPLIPEEVREKFLRWIAHVFRQRRKTLRNNLRSFGISVETIQTVLSRMNIPESIRAEKLDMVTLYEVFKNL
jgi:16S rRNA A1518/A1519 N6-dimethyltransferase RsmA/KsgA/DIM1 with predicted DNA glycosylase/AP lyase activity